MARNSISFHNATNSGYKYGFDVTNSTVNDGTTYELTAWDNPTDDKRRNVIFGYQFTREELVLLRDFLNSVL